MVDTAKLTALGARDFFRLYPLTRIALGPVVAPPLGVAALPAQKTRGDSATSQAAVVKEARVRRFDIAPDTTAFGQIYTHHSRKPVKVLISDFGGSLPLYHLPYNNDENFRITLVDRQGVGNVDFFVTELVDGCSVYVEGTPQAPTVYHLNAISTKAMPSIWAPWTLTTAGLATATWALKHRTMDARFNTDKQKPKTVRNAVAGLRAATKVENVDYMIPADAMASTEARLGEFQGRFLSPLAIAGQSVDSMRFISSQGSVFGARTGGSWKFYIQKRVLVQYFHAGSPAALGLQWVILAVQQFWPSVKTGRIVT